ncbi:hypothetical protein CC80DRAFT_169868 [Byssothecium circinans]|uniref:Uncharacterized protein n=1 Tax=Byssothecium circinans TaxID=147558 RepID=A0A6A5TPM2_9PLEO|nr:hypothetical protein CC80DRAFT_169868 [Byssothecium circinans]
MEIGRTGCTSIPHNPQSLGTSANPHPGACIYFYLPVLVMILINSSVSPKPKTPTRQTNHIPGALILGCTTNKMGLANLYVVKVNGTSAGIFGICTPSSCTWALTLPPSHPAKSIPLLSIWPTPALTLLSLLILTVCVVLNRNRTTQRALIRAVKAALYTTFALSLFFTLSAAQQAALAVNGAEWFGAPRGSVQRGLGVLVLGAVGAGGSLALVGSWELGRWGFEWERTGLVGRRMPGGGGGEM